VSRKTGATGGYLEARPSLRDPLLPIASDRYQALQFNLSCLFPRGHFATTLLI